MKGTENYVSLSREAAQYIDDLGVRSHFMRELKLGDVLGVIYSIGGLAEDVRPTLGTLELSLVGTRGYEWKHEPIFMSTTPIKEVLLHCIARANEIQEEILGTKQ